MSKYPKAIAPAMVGEYPALAKSGAGYFFDEVLEYRVWCHPASDSAVDFDEGDYYYAFETYEEALACAKEAPGAEEPLVLIRQWEWINEPESGKVIHEKGERIAEWRVEWLERGPRRPGEIEAFIKAKTPV
jgi:hypothetical protein